MEGSPLNSMLESSAGTSVKVERNLLKDQVVELLRNQIVHGRIPQGTKLVEREVAELLGVSRAPARDALLELENEGLLVTRPSGRFVIELNERDIRERYQVRLALEKLAVELAARNTSPQNQSELVAKLEEMRQALSQKDQPAYVRCDLETHYLLWQQASNAYLLGMLRSMVGPIFMFIAGNAEHFDWHEVVELHEDLVSCVNAGDAPAAVKSIERHLDVALHRSLRTLERFQQPALVTHKGRVRD